MSDNDVLIVILHILEISMEGDQVYYGIVKI